MFKTIIRYAWGILVGCCVGLGLALPASAEDAAFADENFYNPLDEVRLGVMAHDAYPIWLPMSPADLNFSFRFNQIEDIGFDFFFKSPDLDIFRWIGSPRPNFGGTLNFDDQESMLHLALTWQAHVLDSPVFVEATVGGAIHNGILNGAFGKLRPQGCRVGFYSGLGLGVDLNEQFTATLVYEHISNATLCAPNYGLSNLGIKIGAKFN